MTNPNQLNNIMTAQMRKQASISWFHANNNAISLAISRNISSTEDLSAFIERWRDRFLSQYMQYHHESISNISDESITKQVALARIQDITGIAELRLYFKTLSEQNETLANDPEVLNFAKERASILKHNAQVALQELPIIQVDESELQSTPEGSKLESKTRKSKK